MDSERQRENCNISTYFCVGEEVLYIEVLCYVIMAPARTVAREDRPGHET